MMSSRIDIGLVSRLGFYRVDKFLFSMEYSFFRETEWIKRASGFVVSNDLRESNAISSYPIR